VFYFFLVPFIAIFITSHFAAAKVLVRLSLQTQANPEKHFIQSD